MVTVYTVGHSGRGLGELAGLLLRYGVRLVVDVRSRPGSRRYPWFSRRVLEEKLPSYGVEYYWLGDLLGGLRADTPYPDYVETAGFRRGLGILVSLACSMPGRVAFMCSERYWMRCHRAFIAEAMYHLGFRVLHILDLGRIEEHRVLGVRPSWLHAPLVHDDLC